MPAAITNYRNNDQGVTYSYVGDGGTTTTVPSRETFRLHHFGVFRFVARLFLKKITAKAYVKTEDGAAVNATVTINADRSFTVATSPAVTNLAVANVTVVVNQSTQ